MNLRGLAISLIGILTVITGAFLLSNSLGYTNIDVPAVIGSVIGIGVTLVGVLLIWSYRRRSNTTELERVSDRVARRW